MFNNSENVLKIKMKIIFFIIVVFFVYFGACQNDFCNPNSNEVQTYFPNLNNTASNDTMESLHKNYLDDAMSLLPLCSSINTSDAGYDSIENKTTIYTCEVLSLAENASEVCIENGYCLNFDQSIINSYSNWPCTKTDTCYGLKVVLILTFEYSDLNNAQVASPIGLVFVLNPITNRIINCLNPLSISIDFFVEDDIPTTSEPSTTTNFYNNTSQNNASTFTDELSTTSVQLQCFQFNIKNLTWETNGCNTSEIYEDYVTCKCSGLFLTGVFWINKNVENNTSSFTAKPYIETTTAIDPTTTTIATTNTTYAAGNETTYTTGNKITYTTGNKITYTTGNTTTYAAGNTTTTTLNPTNVYVNLSFSFPKAYNKSDDISVCKACQDKLNLTNDKIKSCTTSNGSTIVNLELIFVSNALNNDLNNIKSLIQNGNLKIIINGVEYVASNDSLKYSHLNDSKPILPSTLSDGENNHLTDAEIAITVVCVIVGVLGLIIIGVFFYMNHKKKHNKRPVSPSDSTSPIDPEEKRHKHSSSEKHGHHNPAFEEKHH